jgi:hypothetical protein
MVNHTRNEHHYTVVIITWLIILGMDTLYGGYIYMVNHTRNEHHYAVVIIASCNYNHCIMVFIPSMINHVIITTVYWCSFLV